MSHYVIQVVCWATGARSEVDGQYLEWYDPDLSVDQELAGFTPDLEKAKKFPDAGAAMTEWRRQRTVDGGLRADGEPDCPLTAFSVNVTRVDE